jgi:WD40 repeat protein
LNKEIDFDLICKGFHSGEISCIDIAVQRPLLITCSKQDSTIRLWNYKTYTCEMAREYYVVEDMSLREAARPLISVAIHPGGYYMAASFIDKIRFHHILHDEF